MLLLPKVTDKCSCAAFEVKTKGLIMLFYSEVMIVVDIAWPAGIVPETLISPAVV